MSWRWSTQISCHRNFHSQHRLPEARIAHILKHESATEIWFERHAAADKVPSVSPLLPERRAQIKKYHRFPETTCAYSQRTRPRAGEMAASRWSQNLLSRVVQHGYFEQSVMRERGMSSPVEPMAGCHRWDHRLHMYTDAKRTAALVLVHAE